MIVGVVEGVAVEGGHVAVQRRCRSTGDGRVRAIRMTIRGLLGGASMTVVADHSGWWCSCLRSRLLEAIGVEHTLRRRVSAGPSKDLDPALHNSPSS